MQVQHSDKEDKKNRQWVEEMVRDHGKTEGVGYVSMEKIQARYEMTVVFKG